MRFQITLTTKNSKGDTSVIGECKKVGAAQAMFDRACIETDAWVRSKAEKGVRVVTGAGAEPNTFVIVMLTDRILNSWTVTLVDTRVPNLDDGLADALAASLTAFAAGSL